MSIYNDPIFNVVVKNVNDLQANDYNPNHVLSQEMKLLKESLLLNGWIQPILINRNNIIVDGFHRSTLSKIDKDVINKYNYQVPCCVLDIDDNEAKMLTIRINKAKGSFQSTLLSALICDLVAKGVSDDDIVKKVGINYEELKLLKKHDIFKKYDFSNYSFSQAWKSVKPEK